jgi:CxxC motif-containing protein (DUF1111 family)
MKRDDSTFLRPNARLPGKTDGTPLSRATFCSAFLMVLALASVTVLQGQFTAQDIGPRAGSVDAGKPVEGLSGDQERFFMNGQTRFKEVDSVSGNMDQEAGVGLGPTFNSNQCSSCGRDSAQLPRIACPSSSLWMGRSAKRDSSSQSTRTEL